MEFLLPVSWVNYGLVFPGQARVEGTRANQLAKLLGSVAPEPIDAIGILLRFSNKHLQVSQRVGRQGHPCHIFVYSVDSWNSMDEWLRDLLKRGNCYSSGSILAQRKVEGAKTVMVPPGANAEEIAKKLPPGVTEEEIAEIAKKLAATTTSPAEPAVALSTNTAAPQQETPSEPAAL